ncbi:hypothetical protein Q4R69_08015 [Morganella morganii subsp. sibonii]
MTKRSDINSGRLIYTEELGWIDTGHAKGEDASVLMNVLNDGDISTKEPYFTVKYTQYMGKGRAHGVSKITRWKVRRGLSDSDKKRVALTIIMYTTHKFESLQDSFPFNWATDSGYSGEDCISNLLGFYKATSDADPVSYLTIVSKEAAYRRWDYYGSIGKYKNKIFQPLIFPDPLEYPNNARPYFVSLPLFLDTVKPISDIATNQILIHVKDTTGINFGAESEWIKIE